MDGFQIEPDRHWLMNEWIRTAVRKLKTPKAGPGIATLKDARGVEFALHIVARHVMDLRCSNDHYGSHHNIYILVVRLLYECSLTIFDCFQFILELVCDYWDKR